MRARGWARTRVVVVLVVVCLEGDSVGDLEVWVAEGHISLDQEHLLSKVCFVFGFSAVCNVVLCFVL